MTRAANLYMFRGELRTLNEIAAIVGRTYQTVRRRIDGNTVKDEFPPKPEPIAFNGKTQSFAAWVRETGISRSALHERLKQYHWPVERALTEPVMGARIRADRQRNTVIITRISNSIRIARMVETFRAIKARETGGQSPIFPNALGTGVGRHARDLQSDKSL